MRAHFPSCIDTQLLQSHNLLTPSDYMIYEQVPVSAPQGIYVLIYDSSYFPDVNFIFMNIACCHYKLPKNYRQVARHYIEKFMQGSKFDRLNFM